MTNDSRTAKDGWTKLDAAKRDQLFAAIAPATCVENIGLDYGGTLAFEDLYTHENTLLGVGGFGLVIPALEKRTKAAVAIKVLNINSYMRAAGAGDRTLRRQESTAVRIERHLNLLKTETDIMQNTSHPNVIEFVRVLHELLWHRCIKLQITS